jgi:hypothetical protein
MNLKKGMIKSGKPDLLVNIFNKENVLMSINPRRMGMDGD